MVCVRALARVTVVIPRPVLLQMGRSEHVFALSVARTVFTSAKQSKISMNNKLYVGNLSYSTQESELRQAFEPFGALVSVSVITDRMTGEPRGFGFVEYEHAGDAQRAIESVNGREVGGRALNVSVAREREPKPRFNDGGDFRGSGGGRKRTASRGGNRW